MMMHGLTNFKVPPFYETLRFQYGSLCMKLPMDREGERRERERKVFYLTWLSIVKIVSRRKQKNVI
jgi:hypothetical protein